MRFPRIGNRRAALRGASKRLSIAQVLIHEPPVTAKRGIGRIQALLQRLDLSAYGAD